MYQSHWGLEKSPFPSGVDPRLFYEGTPQREALARLRFLLSNRRRLGVVLGAPGLGKTSLLEVFGTQSTRAGHTVAQIEVLGLSTREFYLRLGTELQATVRVEDDLVRLFRQISDRIQANVLQQRQTVLLLDDLDQAGPDLLGHVQRLLRTDQANAGWLSIIAATNPEQLNRLGRPLLELVDLRIDLQPWDELDTIGYVQMALLEAGAQQPLFDEAAMSELHRLSAGAPRLVNRLADFALLAGANQSLPIVDLATVEAAGEAVSSPSLAT